jgi:hypothetical protein
VSDKRGCVRSFAVGCAVTRERERVFFNLIKAWDCYNGAL